MRRLKQYTVERDPFERPLLTYADKEGLHSVEISAGEVDEIEVFRESGVTYVLSWNQRRNYAALEAFVRHTKVGELFLQHSSSLEAKLGKKGLQLTAMTVAKRMADSLTPRLNECEYQLPGAAQQSKAVSLEITFEDLTPEAQKCHLDFYNGEPPLGLIAILERDEKGL